jgi:hypothetical protein
MLDEARRRQERGQDVVVGAIQAQVSGLGLFLNPDELPGPIE